MDSKVAADASDEWTLETHSGWLNRGFGLCGVAE